MRCTDQELERLELRLEHCPEVMVDPEVVKRLVGTCRYYKRQAEIAMMIAGKGSEEDRRC